MPAHHSIAKKIDAVCDGFEKQWTPESTPGISKFLDRIDQSYRQRLLEELLAVDVELRFNRGHRVNPEEYRSLGDVAVGIVNRLVSELAGQTAEVPSLDCPDYIGRYHVLEEIARGGMGAVIRAEDPEFGRTLAIKISLPKYQGNEEAEKRFLSEAKITGRLQHPGIPPVHEFGSLPDGRAYFAMKLIDGQTLSSLLNARQNPAEGRDRFLNIFENLCQTIAYAHDNFIVHRDLKPANIMIGAFGEVQVMDWGLAKDLRPGSEEADLIEGKNNNVVRVSGDTFDDALAPTLDFACGANSAGEKPGGTRLGAVLGTPAYMAPEQARGDIQRIDEQSDVFSLGAILCEILIGRPPFIGKTPSEIVEKVRECNCAETFAELENCDVDPELITLAKRCLVDDKRKRAGAAMEIAEGIRGSRERVQQRLHDAEVTAARAEAKANEEQSRRQVERQRNRLWRYLAASILVLVLAGAAAGFYVQEQRQANFRRELADMQIVNSGLDRVAELRVSVQPDEARAALAQVREMLPKIAQPQIVERAERELLLLNLLDELDRLKERRANVIQFLDSASVDDDYWSVIESAGLIHEDDEPVVVAKRISDSEIRDQLLDAIETWASVTKRPDRLKDLLAVARILDPHEVRDRLRDFDTWQDASRVRELIRTVDIKDWTPSLAMAFALKSKGRPGRLLQQLLQSHPDDFWLNRMCGINCKRKRQYDEAIGYFRAALALRPDSPWILENLGNALEDSGKRDEAIECFARACELNPNHWGHRDCLAQSFFATGRTKEALEQHKLAVEYGPEVLQANFNYAMALAKTGQHEKSIEKLEKVLEINPDYAEAYFQIGSVYHGRMQQPKEAEPYYREAIRLGCRNEYCAKFAGMCFAELELHDEAVQLLEDCLKADSDQPDILQSLAACHFKTGNIDLSREYAEKAEALYPPDDPNRQVARRLLSEIDAMAELSFRLNEVLDGIDEPEDNQERVELAMFCFAKTAQYKAAVDFFRDAFEVDPELAGIGGFEPYRNHAGIAAAMAATGKGADSDDLTQKEKLELLSESRDWLDAEVTYMVALMEKTSDKRILKALRLDLTALLETRRLDGVRKQDQLALLPEAERKSWEQFWSKVEMALELISD